MAEESLLAIRNELGPNERILWTGRPKLGLTFRSADVVLIPFSLAWAGCAFAWVLGVFLLAAPLVFGLVGILFALVGLYFVFGRFLVDARQRAGTYYALTTKRIIILSGLLGRKARSLSLKSMPGVHLDNHANGTGTITFGPRHPLGWMYSGNWWPDVGQYTPDCLDMISDAQFVHDKIREVQESL